MHKKQTPQKKLKRAVQENAIISSECLPKSLSAIPELDLSNDLTAPRLSTDWFRLASIGKRDTEVGEDAIRRKSFLLKRGMFSRIYTKLGSVYHHTNNLGTPRSMVEDDGNAPRYMYQPFYQYQLDFIDCTAEPLAFEMPIKSGIDLILNPDIYLYLRLEKLNPDGKLWWDPVRSIEVIRTTVSDDTSVQSIDIRVDYLEKYIQARQMSLVVGHYRHLLLRYPTEEVMTKFEREELTLGSAKTGTKAMMQSYSDEDHRMSNPAFAMRRLDLWFEIKPSKLDINDPWSDEPSFDVHNFTFQTDEGDVAPGRWKDFKGKNYEKFAGVVGDFSDVIFFKQEVLSKYQGTVGFTITDNGGITCFDEWGLTRSTWRIGNELIATWIGDFAEGVRLCEWPHWKQFSTSPPSEQAVELFGKELPIPKGVSNLCHALDALNGAFSELTELLGNHEPLVWTGSEKSLACRQLKWVYPVASGEEEFLTRATLMSTLVVEELHGPALRRVLSSLDSNFDKNSEDSPRPLGSRNLLQRLGSVASVITSLNVDGASVAELVLQAEGCRSNDDKDVESELRKLHEKVREIMRPLAFLYDLRNCGGVAHSVKINDLRKLTSSMNMPKSGWGRTEFLQLLLSVTEAIDQLRLKFESAAEVLSEFKYARRSSCQ